MASSADYLPVNGRFRVIETRLPREADVQRVMVSGGSVSDVRSLLQGSVLELPADGVGSVVSQFDQAYAAAYRSLLEVVEQSAPGSAVTQWIQTRSEWVRIRSIAKLLVEGALQEESAVTMADIESLRATRSNSAQPWFEAVLQVVVSVRADLLSADSDAARASAWERARTIDILADKGVMEDLMQAVKADRAQEIRSVLRSMCALMQMRVAVRLSHMEASARPAVPSSVSAWFDGALAEPLNQLVDASTTQERSLLVQHIARQARLTPVHIDTLLNALDQDAIAFEHAALFVEQALLAGRASGMEGAIPVLAFFTSLERSALLVRVALMTAAFGLDTEFMAQRLGAVGVNV